MLSAAVNEARRSVVAVLGSASNGAKSHSPSVENHTMSTRERWIVYPLLFMTLGIAMRDKVIPPVRLGSLGLLLQAGDTVSQRIRCRELQVERVVVNNGPNQPPVVVLGSDNNTHAGFVETLNTEGMPQVRLSSTETGGIVSTIGRAGKAALLLGDTGQNLGVTVEVPELHVRFPLLSAPSRIEIKPTAPPQGEAPAASPTNPPTKKTEEVPEKNPT
jgi:hypothetical protein